MVCDTLHLLKIWDDIPTDVVRAACDSFVPRMKEVVQAKEDRGRNEILPLHVILEKLLICFSETSRVC